MLCLVVRLSCLHTGTAISAAPKFNPLSCIWSRGARLHALCRMVEFPLSLACTRIQPFQAARGVVAPSFKRYVGWWNCHYLWHAHRYNPFKPHVESWRPAFTGYVGWCRNCHNLWHAYRYNPFKPFVGSWWPAFTGYVGWYRNRHYLWHVHR